MEGYPTKASSGYISLGGPVSFAPEADQRFSRMNFTQWYNAKLKKSFFTIDLIMVRRDYFGSGSVIDGKIKINGNVLYTASKRSKDTYLSNEVVDVPGDDLDWRTVKTTKIKDEYGNDSTLSLGFEINHDENGTGKVSILLVGNAASRFTVNDPESGKSGTCYPPGHCTVSFDDGRFYCITDDKEDLESDPLYYISYLPLESPKIPTISEAKETVIGENCSIKINSENGYYHKISFTCREWNSTITLSEENTVFNEGIATSYFGVLPMDVLYAIPDTSSYKMEAVLLTYFDSEYTNIVGYSDPVYFYVYAPPNIVPTITSSEAKVLFTDNNFDLGEAVSEYSYVKLLASAQGAYGSYIEKYIISGAYNTEVESRTLEYIGNVIMTSGLKEFSITAVDSRGRRSVACQHSVYFYGYEPPKILAFEAYRNPDNNIDIMCRTVWKISPVNGKNTCSGVIKYKKTSEGTWMTLCNVQSNSALSLDNPIESENGWDKYTSYEFKLVVTDGTKSYAEQIKMVPTVKVIIDFKSPKDKESIGGIGIGKASELDDFVEIWLNAKFYNSVYIGDKTLSDFIVGAMRIQAENIVVSAGDFTEYSPLLSNDYPYRAEIPIAGVDSSMIPEVFFSIEDAQDRVFAPFANSFDGGVYLYAESIPDSQKIIPLITCWR